MAEIAYLDFDLLIEPARDGYRARVLSSPAGEGTTRFSRPFSDLEVENFLLRMGRPRGGVRRLESPEMQAARTFGGRLFEAVLGEEIRERLRGSLNAASRRGAGLRIRLRLAETPELADLPWEYLYDPALERFLVLSVETPLVRYLDPPQPVHPLPLQPPLRVLAMIASPTDCPPMLQVDQEWARIQQALIHLERRNLVVVERLEQATMAALQRRLRRGEYHIFHFVGHGGFYEHVQDGVLMVEDAQGRGRPVSGRHLGTMLHDHRSLRLAVLNACEGARASRSDPFAGIAQNLVRQGIPAVIAMQFPITDSAAITLAHEFYAALADGYGVDAALAEARKAIFAASKDVEWGTPVLHLSTPDGRIFDIVQAQALGALAPDLLSRSDALELKERLEQLYTEGLGAFYLERWEEAIRSFQAIVDVQPDYRNAADRLAEAQLQSRLSVLHAQARAAAESLAWPQAIAALEELVDLEPEFQDAASLLERARTQNQLSELYAEAKQLFHAERWRAVVNVFAQLRDIQSDVADPDELLVAAEQNVAELERQEALNDMYGRAMREMDAGRWAEAAQLLARVQALEPSFGDAQRLLERTEREIAREQAKRRRQSQVEALYAQAQELARQQQWQQALDRIHEIETLSPDFADADGIAAQAQNELERRRRRDTLYERAQAAQQASDWQASVAALEELTAEAPEDRQAAALLREARRQAQLAGLYARARHAHGAAQWQAVVEAFAQIQAIEPDYPDPDGLLAAARQQIAEETERAELDDLYRLAAQEIEAGRLAEARQVLVRIQAQKPGFRDVDRRLERVEAELERQKNERRRQEQVDLLYEQAQSLTHHRQWQPALSKMREIEALDPQFDDPEGVAARAQEAVARKEQETRRQRELVALYAEAVRRLEDGQYQEALARWAEVQRLDPRYPDRKRVQSTAQKRLAALARGARAQPRLPRWAMFAIGALALIIAVVASILLRGALGERERQLAVAPATPTAQPQPAVRRTRTAPTATAPAASRVPEAILQATVKAEKTAQSRATSEAKVWAARTRSQATSDASLTRIAQARTDKPIATAEPLAPLSEILADVVVTDHDDFARESELWMYEGNVSASDGKVEMIGTAERGADITRRTGLRAGQGALLLFKYTPGAEYNSVFMSGEWGTPGWKKLDFNSDWHASVQSGQQSSVLYYQCAFDEIFTPAPDTWYYLLFAVDQEGAFLVRTWERDDLAQNAQCQWDLGPDWDGLSWTFNIGVVEKTATLDSYTEVSFSQFKSPDDLPSPVTEILDDAAVVDHDDFGSLRSSQWTHDGQVSASDGTIEMIGTPDWGTRLKRQNSIRAGQGMLLLLKYSPDPSFALDLQTGEMDQPSWRSLAIYPQWPSSNIWQGSVDLGGGALDGNLEPKAGTWYYCLYAVDKGGTFLVSIWERDDPSQRAEQRWNLGPDWDGLAWKLEVLVNKETLYLDSFTEVSFSKLNPTRF